MTQSPYVPGPNVVPVETVRFRAKTFLMGQLARLEGLVGALALRGVVAEWLNAAVLKTAERVTVP